MLSIVFFYSVIISLWAHIFIFEMCGPNGIIAPVRLWWYHKAFSECDDGPKSKFMHALWKPIFSCATCHSGWVAILFFTFTTYNPFAVWVGMVLSMSCAKLLEKYVKFN